MGFSALAGAHCLCANTPSPPVWQQCRPRSIPCTAPPPAYWPLPIHTQPLSLLSGQQLQSLALHCIANGCQTISQERKELCSAIYQVMATWFNAVASDPWDKCDNWHYYHPCVFCWSFMYRSDQNAADIWQFLIVFRSHLPKCFYTADWAENSVTCSVCILCWHDYITIQNLQTSILVTSMLLTSFMNTFTLTALHALKTWWDFSSHIHSSNHITYCTGKC